MKQSIATMLEMFKEAPDSIETRKAYEHESQNWNSVDVASFWESAITVYPKNDYVNLAQKVITCLLDNDLIEYHDTKVEFISWYKVHGAKTDIGLTSFITDYVKEQADVWLEAYATAEMKEMRERLENELADLTDDERRKVINKLASPSLKLLQELCQAPRKCWYWSWLFKYYIKASGIVEEIISAF